MFLVQLSGIRSLQRFTELVALLYQQEHICKGNRNYLEYNFHKRSFDSYLKLLNMQILFSIELKCSFPYASPLFNMSVCACMCVLCVYN